MEVYVATEVAEVHALHSYLADPAFRKRPIRDQIAQQAETVRTAHSAGDRRVRMQILSWWPDARGLGVDDIMQAGFTSDDARLTLAREYGFSEWHGVELLGSMTPDAEFELALDDMLSGDAESLDGRLEKEPRLVDARSRYGHAATLLHYLGANGVESHRQVTPLNAAELAGLLVRHGANIAAEADIYGGGQTALALARSSAHPHEAGIAEELNAVLGAGPC